MYRPSGETAPERVLEEQVKETDLSATKYKTEQPTIVDPVRISTHIIFFVCILAGDPAFQF